MGRETDEIVTYLSDSRDLKVIDILNRYPVLSWLWIYAPARPLWLRKTLMWFVPAGGILYLISLPYTHRLRDAVERILTTSRALSEYRAE